MSFEENYKIYVEKMSSAFRAHGIDVANDFFCFLRPLWLLRKTGTGCRPWVS